MSKLANKETTHQQMPILKQIYLLIGLLILFAAIIVIILLKHMREQQNLFDEINYFHAPTIFYTNKLIGTLQEIKYTARNKTNREKSTNIFKNPVYLIKSYTRIVKELADQYPRAETEHAHRRLQQDISLLTEALQNQATDNKKEPHEYLPTLTQSSLIRAEQLNRLHTNAIQKLRNKFAEREKNIADLLIKMTISIVAVSGVLIIPLLANIRRMLNYLQNSELQQRELKEIAEHERSRMRALLSAMRIGVLFEDKQGHIEFVNPAFYRLWAINANRALIGQEINELLKQSSLHFTSSAHSSKHVMQVHDKHEISEGVEIDFDNGQILTQLSFPVLDNGKDLLGRLWIYEDITHERQTAQQLLYLAEHDPLTGLYNRHRFKKQLAFMMNTSCRNGNRFALLYFDLDEFKFINDTFGHGVGDSVLMRTASEISVLVRGVEMFARLGGDEFALIAALRSDDEISALPVRIIDKIASIPFRFQETNLRLTASVGVAIYPEHGNNVEDLVAHADAAMYQAKNFGKNTWSIYNPERNNSAKMITRLSWSRLIGLALERNLFELYFQGIYHTDTLKLLHLEVLIRMRDPEESEKLIMPSAFIPFAEKTAQIVEIDRWMLDRSIALLAQHPELTALAVNISGRSFDEPSLPDFIKEKINHYDINPARLILELTETETVSDFHDAQRFIETIRQVGCRICLDDFGSGFSTFVYLKYLDVEILKIDGMFIHDLLNNKENQVIVKAMVDIAHGLEKSLVAEFVENAETLQLLQNIGVEYAQGYYFDRPVSQRDILLQQH